MSLLPPPTAVAVVLCCLSLRAGAFAPMTHLSRLRRRSTIPILVSASSVGTTAVPRISPSAIKDLAENGYAIIPNFLPPDLVSDLNKDVSSLRSNQKFNIARIGQDSTNKLNTDIRVAETCFIGRQKLQDCPDAARDRLYDALDSVRADLSANPILDEKDAITGTLIKGASALDSNLSELLYAFYPQGGFYRRHRDAIPGSASVLRCYSLLLYLNEDWKEEDAGQLRMHFDSGGDFCPDGEEPNYIDVEPRGGTLVLFKSDLVPHEVLDTKSERSAVVGWYNRAVTAADINELASEEDKMRAVMLLVAVGLVTAGVLSLVS